MTSTPARRGKYPFGLGGVASALSVLFTHPLDVTKVRMQIVKNRPSSAIELARSIAQAYGVRALYDGLSAAVLRSLTYSFMRIGAYEELKPHFSKLTATGEPNLASMVAAAGVAGGVAGLLGNPADVVLVRMASDRARPVAERFHYRNPIMGLYTIGRTEGLSALYKGVLPNTARGVMMNCAQLVSYDSFKTLLRKNEILQDGIAMHVTSSILAGTVATTVSAPADVVRSRMMASRKVGKAMGVGQVVADAYKKEGLRYFFRGWAPAWMRLCPQTVLTLVFLEQLKAVLEREWRISQGLENRGYVLVYSRR